jgi:hypothetical protein
MCYNTLCKLQIHLDVYTAYLEKCGWLNAADTTTISSRSTGSARATVAAAAAAVHSDGAASSSSEFMALDLSGYEAVILEIALLLYPTASCTCKACIQERKDVRNTILYLASQ